MAKTSTHHLPVHRPTRKAYVIAEMSDDELAELRAALMDQHSASLEYLAKSERCVR